MKYILGADINMLLGESDLMGYFNMNYGHVKSQRMNSSTIFLTLKAVGGGCGISKKNFPCGKFNKVSDIGNDESLSGRLPTNQQISSLTSIHEGFSNEGEGHSSHITNGDRRLYGKSDEFEDWKEEIFTETPESSTQIAILLQKQDRDYPMYQKWRKRALRMIRIYKSDTISDYDGLDEIIPLSKAADKEISEEIIMAIGSKLENKLEKLPKTLLALKTVLSNTLREKFDTILLAAVLDILMDRIGNLYACQTDTANELTESLVTILNCLYVSGATGMPQEKYKEYKKSFDQSWIDKALEKRGADDRERSKLMASQAKRALFVELLKRIGDDQDKIIKSAKIAGKIALGLFNAASSAISFDVFSAISALMDVKAAVDETEMKEKWFDVYFSFRLSLACGTEKAIELLDGLASNSHTIHINAAFLIVDTIAECFYATKEGLKRKRLIQLLDKLTSYDTWKGSAELQTYMHILKGEMLAYKPKQLKSYTLFERSGIDTTSYKEVIDLIKEKTTKNQEFDDRFSNYIPCQVKIPANKNKHHDAIKLIRDFLQQSNKESNILLILGDSGSGKSLLQQYTVRELWREYESGKGLPIPLYTPLTALEKPREKAIYNLLSASTKNSLSDQGLEFSEEHINLLKKDHKFIFFLDAFDEIEFTSTSIYHSNNLAEWKDSKFIFGCRRQFIENINNYQKLFAPVDEGNAKSIQEIHIAPFTKEQRVQYFEQYASLHEECKWRQGIYFEQQLLLIPSLAELAVTPFMIFLAASTLPDIHRKYAEKSHDKEHVKLIRTDFFKQFAESWFEREERKIRKSYSIVANDFPDDLIGYLYSYCLDLASYMFTENKIALQYTWDPRKNTSNNSALDEYFGNNPGWLKIVQRAAPIKKTDAQTFEFIHKSVYEFFASDAIVHQFMTEEELRSHVKGSLPQSTSLTTNPLKKHDQENIGDNPPSTFLKTPSISRLVKITQSMIERRKENKTPVESLNRPVEYAILVNLSEQVHKSAVYEKQLFDIVYSSRSNEKISQAAANAITILNYANIPFTNMDLTGIKIAGADLSRSILDGADFSGADLSKVSFVDACLGSCNFNKSTMSNIKFGRLPLLLGHTNIIRSICSLKGPNGECWLASASGNSRKLFTEEPDHDESTIVGDIEDYQIRIWDLQTGEEVRKLPGHTNSVTSVCSIRGPKGKCYLASGSCDRTIRIWDVATGSEVRILRFHKNSVRTLCAIETFDNQSLLISGGGDRNVYFGSIDEEPPKTLAEIEIDHISKHGEVIKDKKALSKSERIPIKYKKPIQELSYNSKSDNQYLSIFCRDNSLHIWSIVETRYVFDYSQKDQEITSTSKVSGPNGECWFACGTKAGVIQILAWEKKRKIDLKGHTKDISTICNLVGPKGECWLASGSADTTVRLWDIATGLEIKTLNGHLDPIRSICSVKGPNDECWLASGSEDKTIRIWDLSTLSGNTMTNFHTGSVSHVVYIISKSGEIWLASGSADKTIRIWDKATGSELKTFDGHIDAVTSICSVNGPNGECWLASGSRDKTIRTWDIATGSEIKTLNGHIDSVTSVCSVNGPNGECWLASGSRDKTIRIWDIATGSEIKTLNGHIDSVTSICSVNGPKDRYWLASGSGDNKIIIWDIATGSEINTLNGHTSFVNSVCSVNGPNGESWLASGSGDKTIRIWDIATGSEIKTLSGHNGAILTLCLINEPSVGCYCASGGSDGTVRIWNLASMKEILILSTFSKDVNSVCYFCGLEGELWLASGSSNKTIRVWEMNKTGGKSKSNHSGGDNPTRISEKMTGISTLESCSLRDMIDQVLSYDQLRFYTKMIIGPRRLEGGNLFIDGVIGLSTLNKKLLHQEGAASFDSDFASYCDLGNFTKFQAIMMSIRFSEGIGVEKSEGKRDEWMEKSFNVQSVPENIIDEFETFENHEEIQVQDKSDWFSAEPIPANQGEEESIGSSAQFIIPEKEPEDSADDALSKYSEKEYDEQEFLDYPMKVEDQLSIKSTQESVLQDNLYTGKESKDVGDLLRNEISSFELTYKPDEEKTRQIESQIPEPFDSMSEDTQSTIATTDSEEESHTYEPDDQAISLIESETRGPFDDSYEQEPIMSEAIAYAKVDQADHYDYAPQEIKMPREDSSEYSSEQEPMMSEAIDHTKVEQVDRDDYVPQQIEMRKVESHESPYEQESMMSEERGQAEEEQADHYDYALQEIKMPREDSSEYPREQEPMMSEAIDHAKVEQADHYDYALQEIKMPREDSSEYPREQEPMMSEAIDHAKVDQADRDDYALQEIKMPREDSSEYSSLQEPMMSEAIDHAKVDQADRDDYALQEIKMPREDSSEYPREQEPMMSEAIDHAKVEQADRDDYALQEIKMPREDSSEYSSVQEPMMSEAIDHAKVDQADRDDYALQEIKMPREDSSEYSSVQEPMMSEAIDHTKVEQVDHDDYVPQQIEMRKVESHESPYEQESMMSEERGHAEEGQDYDSDDIEPTHGGPLVFANEFTASEH